MAGLISALFVGIVIERRHAFPSYLLTRAKITWDTLRRSALAQNELRELIRVVPSASVARNATSGPSRVQFVGSTTLADPILFTGGYRQFNEYCPAPAVGCLAVEYAGDGEVVDVWPYYPDRIFLQTGGAGGYLELMPHEIPIGWSAVHNTSVIDAAKYDNGDLLVVFHYHNAFPFAGGMARVDRGGSLIWHRRDYAHHSLSMLDSGRVWVSGKQLVERGQRGGGKCVAMVDVARLVDGTGSVVRELPVTAAVEAFPWRRDISGCLATHMNSVHEVGFAASDGGGFFDRGDLIVSLRNLSVFGVLDRDSGHLKHAIRGRFRRQHDVVHLSGSKFILFDNAGTGTRLSRVLIVDPVQGTEVSAFPRTGGGIFIAPHSTANGMTRLYSERQGGISVSSDRTRAIATFTEAGRAVEFRISDGRVLTIFDGFHDMISSSSSTSSASNSGSGSSEDGAVSTGLLYVGSVTYSREARPSDTSSRK